MPIAFFTMAYSLSPSDNAVHCSSNEYFRKLVFEGLVIDKFLDKTQHSVPVILIKNYSDSAINKISLADDVSGIYGITRVGNVLKKDFGHNDVYILYNNAFVELRKAEFRCDSIALDREPLIFNLYKLFQ